MTTDVDRDTRLHIYRAFVDLGFPPTVEETAAALGRTAGDIQAAYRRLADGHVIVLKPDSLDIWMANPLSAVPTPFRAVAGGRRWWGNCAWDAPGILAMLREDGRIETTCPDCDEPLAMAIRDGELEPLDAVAHFAVRAAKWWDDIGYT